MLGLVLATAAICVAVAAIGVTIVGLPGQGSPGAQDAAKSGPPSSVAHRAGADIGAAEVDDHNGRATQTGGPGFLAKRYGHLSAELGLGVDRGQRQRALLARGAGQQPAGPDRLRGHARGRRAFLCDGPGWIRLGNPPAVAVKVNGTPMTVPGSQLAEPVNLQFTFG